MAGAGWGVEHRELLGKHFHCPGSQPFIQGSGWPSPHAALHLQYGFRAQMFCHRKCFWTQIGIHGDLHGAAAVAQVDKDHPAMVAAAINPAAKQHFGVDGVGAQVAAGVAAHGGCSANRMIPCRRFSCGDRRGVSPPGPVPGGRGYQRLIQCPAWLRPLAHRPGQSVVPGLVPSCRL